MLNVSAWSGAVITPFTSGLMAKPKLNCLAGAGGATQQVNQVWPLVHGQVAGSELAAGAQEGAGDLVLGRDEVVFQTPSLNHVSPE
jgi:hypothetical protein